MKVLRIIPIAIGMLLVFAVNIKPVQADPHAVFYTTTGQQQLFFNILAALDQADYVELATDSLGTSSGNSREELLEARTTAGFSAEDAPVIEETITDLSSLLTRSITLEGADLWTAFLVRQDAIEKDRRRNLTELAKILCGVSLGAKDCAESGVEDNQTTVARRKRSFVVSPEEEIAAVNDASENAFLAAVDPALDQEERKKLLDKSKSLEHNNYRPYDYATAEIARRSQGNAAREGILSRWISYITAPVTSGALVSALDNINPDGSVDIGENGSADDLISTLSLFLGTPNQILGSDINYRATQEKINETKIDDGAIALTYPVKEAKNGLITNIQEHVGAPVAAQKTQVQTAIQGIADAEVTRYDVETDQAIQGTEKATEFISHLVGLEPGGNVPGVRGISTESPTSGGTVLALTDDVQNAVDAAKAVLDDPEGVGPNRGDQPLFDVADGPTSNTREPTIEDLLKLFAGGTKSGGCGCSWDDVVSGYGNGV